MPPKKSLHQANNDDESDNKGHVVSVSFPSPFVQKRLGINQVAIEKFRDEINKTSETFEEFEGPEEYVRSCVANETENIKKPENEGQNLKILGENIPISNNAAEILRDVIAGRKIPEIIVEVRDILPTVRFNFPNSEEEEEE